MLSIRFAIGAVALFLALLLTHRPILAAPGERLRLVLLAIFGYAIEASLFFTATQHGTVAAVTLLFFTYPVFVTAWAWALGGDLPARLTVVALLCAVAGAAIVKPLTPAPVAVPFSSISRTALLPTGSVLAADPTCE